jgi:hypothetical protein
VAARELHVPVGELADGDARLVLRRAAGGPILPDEAGGALEGGGIVEAPLVEALLDPVLVRQVEVREAGRLVLDQLLASDVGDDRRAALALPVPLPCCSALDHVRPPFGARQLLPGIPCSGDRTAWSG